MSQTYVATIVVVLSELLRWGGWSVNVDSLNTTINTLVSMGGGIWALVGQIRTEATNPAQYVPSVTIILTGVTRLMGVSMTIEQLGTSAVTVAAIVAGCAGLVTRYLSGGVSMLGARTET